MKILINMDELTRIAGGIIMTFEREYERYEAQVLAEYKAYVEAAEAGCVPDFVFSEPQREREYDHW